MQTTLAKIRDCSPCYASWKKLLQHLNKTEADYEPLSLLTILESNGVSDAAWCMRAVEGYEKEKRLFGVWSAWQVRQLMDDQISLKAVHAAESYAHNAIRAWVLREAHEAAERVDVSSLPNGKTEAASIAMYVSAPNVNNYLITCLHKEALALQTWIAAQGNSATRNLNTTVDASYKQTTKAQTEYLRQMLLSLGA